MNMGVNYPPSFADEKDAVKRIEDLPVTVGQEWQAG
jgi:hypothetical protein